MKATVLLSGLVIAIPAFAQTVSVPGPAIVYVLRLSNFTFLIVFPPASTLIVCGTVAAELNRAFNVAAFGEKLDSHFVVSPHVPSASAVHVGSTW